MQLAREKRRAPGYAFSVEYRRISVLSEREKLIVQRIISKASARTPTRRNGYDSLLPRVMLAPKLLFKLLDTALNGATYFNHDCGPSIYLIAVTLYMTATVVAVMIPVDIGSHAAASVLKIPKTLFTIIIKNPRLWHENERTNTKGRSHETSVQRLSFRFAPTDSGFLRRTRITSSSASS